MLEWDDTEYISCDWIENAVTFLSNSLSFCCGGMKESLFYFDGGEFPSEKFFSSKKDLLIRIQKNQNNPCFGCNKLIKKKWIKNTYPISHIVISNSNLCNLKCVYCRDVVNDRHIETYDISQIMDAMISARLMSPHSRITWGDGEPVLLKNFIPVLTLSLRYGLTNEILSNCTIYSESIAEGLSKNILNIRCSIDAGTRECYTKIKGKDLLDRVWDNLKKYADINHDLITVKYIFLENNCSKKEIAAFLERLSQAGVKRLLISQDVYKYRGTWSNSIQNMPDAISDGIVFMMIEALKKGIIADLQTPYFIQKDIWILKIRILGELIRDSCNENEKYIKQIYNSISDGLIKEFKCH